MECIIFFNRYQGKTEDMSWRGSGMEDMSSSYFFNNGRVEIILTSFFTIPSRGIGPGLSDRIIYSFKLFAGIH